jgi:protein-S-isoprenylcysteine O-methyltransferase Ste14
MQATRFEFEQRFWVIGAIFWVGFSLSWIDHTGFVVGVAKLLAPAIDPGSDSGRVIIRGIFIAAAMLVFAAAAVRTWATAYLRTEIVHDPRQHSENLMADGPYRYVRNPLYLGVWLMTLGVATMASRIGWLWIVLAMAVFMYRLTFREEAGLLATQGESFRAYVKAVPRMIPSPWARVPAGSTRPRWGQAFVGELFFWLMGAGMVVLVITLDMRLTGLIFLGSMVVYFVAVGTMKRRAARPVSP